MLRTLPISWLMLLLPAWAGADVKPEWSREIHCDIPGHNLSGKTLSNPDECKDACSNQKGCAGFTFVTGWNRCQLKSAVKPRYKIKMFAAKITKVDGQRKAITPLEAYDHKGKDLERKPRSVKNASACAKECLNVPACLGYVFIQGYSACWLKRTDGALQPKQFICGYRK